LNVQLLSVMMKQIDLPHLQTAPFRSQATAPIQHHSDYLSSANSNHSVPTTLANNKLPQKG
jgi:two-component system response regulator PilR (NtrC family)